MRELSLHILDLLQNAVEAGATRIELTIEENLADDRLNITVSDNGRGMDALQVTKATDPFFTTRKIRHVGLGLPLLASAAEQCGGSLSIRSQPGFGTTVTATFKHSHIDRAPLGNVPDTLLAFLLGAENVDLHFRHRVNDREFELDTANIRQMLGDVPLSHPKVRNWLRDFIAEGEAELYQPT